MRSVRTRLLPLLFAALCLPLQAVAAIGMPLCRHGEVPSTIATVEEAAPTPCPLHEPAPVPAGQGQDCDNCGVCHLLAGGFLPSAEPRAAAMALSHHYRADAALAPASAIPEPPQQPPKRLA